VARSTVFFVGSIQSTGFFLGFSVGSLRRSRDGYNSLARPEKTNRKKKPEPTKKTTTTTTTTTRKLATHSLSSMTSSLLFRRARALWPDCVRRLIISASRGLRVFLNTHNTAPGRLLVSKLTTTPRYKLRGLTPLRRGELSCLRISPTPHPN